LKHSLLFIEDKMQLFNAINQSGKRMKKELHLLGGKVNWGFCYIVLPVVSDSSSFTLRTGKTPYMIKNNCPYSEVHLY
jgi:hypothetical protein